MSQRPLVLVHGLWNTPRLFNRLIEALGGRRRHLLAPHLEHGLGHVPLLELTEMLEARITGAFGAEEPLDLLGFSMGGLLARAWIHWCGGDRRTGRFLCVGSPQRGTLTAQLVPRAMLAGIADMKIGSRFLRELDAAHRKAPQSLGRIDCCSYICRSDLMVIPSWRGVLPVGPVVALPAAGHLGLVNNPSCAALLAEALIGKPRVATDGSTPESLAQMVPHPDGIGDGRE